MVAPNVESSTNVIGAAIRNAGLTPADIGYINTHGTSTGIGDPVEIQAIQRLFGDTNPSVAINSTKSQTGHTIGAAGALEAIFTTMMMEHSFVSGTVNLNTPDEAAAWANLIRKTQDYSFDHALSNSFGFGGANATLILSRHKD